MPHSGQVRVQGEAVEVAVQGAKRLEMLLLVAAVQCACWPGSCELAASRACFSETCVAGVLIYVVDVVAFAVTVCGT